jgi:hypothetical protein
MSAFKTNVFNYGHNFIRFIPGSLKQGTFELWHYFVNRVHIKKSKNQWKINN